MRSLSIEHPEIEFPVMSKGSNRGAPKPSTKHIENTEALLVAYGMNVRYNLMRHSLEVTIPGFETEMERSENTTVQVFRSLVQRHGLSPDAALGHLLVLADSYHPVRDWIESRPWDGQDRWHEFLATIELQDEDKEHIAHALVKRWMVSAVKAVMPDKRGERKFTPQGVLTFQGPQGIGKTEWFKSLAPQDKDWICTGRIVEPHNRDSVQQITGYWISELGELDATFKKSDVVAMKAFITQFEDVYRSAYATREERIPRRTMMGASVNPQMFLADDTGNRRWWSVAVQKLNWRHKIDMQQLWAQVATWVAAGEQFWLNEEEMQWLNESNKDHEVQEPLLMELHENWRVAAVSEVGKYPRVKIFEIWDALPTRTGRPMDRVQHKMLSEALFKMGARNPGKSNGACTYRVERINQPVMNTGFGGGYGGFKPVTYND